MFASRSLLVAALTTFIPVAAGTPPVPSRGAPPRADSTDLARVSVAPLAPVVLDSAFLAGYRWRNIGPDRGGRSIAVTGVKGRPKEAYFGAVGGGLWKTTDGGENWFPVTDGQISSASVGAVAVSESDPDIVFIGTGESCIRNNIMPGDGVYKSTDGGKTWTHVGFEGVDAISKIRIDPSNPNIVYVAAFGKYSEPSAERGVFKSTDGGKSWRKVLYRDDKTGAIDISIDPEDHNVVYAALWEAYRNEYHMSSGGPGSGLFKSTDGGETWKEITRTPGMPSGVVGRIGVSVSPANTRRVYALVENDSGGLFRSDDAGATWKLVNDNRAIRQRAFYYTHVFADPKNADVVYMENTSLFRSKDGGKTTEAIRGTHGDFHDLWIDPDDPAHLVVGNDGGGAVSMNTGGRWTDEDYPTGQFYHVATTAHIPYHVCGAQQDNSTLCVPFDWNVRAFEAAQRSRRDSASNDDDDEERGASSGDITAGGMALAYDAGGGEPGYIAPDPRDPELFYSGTNNGGYIDKYNRRTGQSREVNPYPWFYSGEPSKDIKERWQWTFPIIFSPLDPKTLYTSSQRLWRTTDGGQMWTALSGDLTRHDPKTQGKSGGPITGDMNGPEVYGVIFSVGPSKKDINVIWTGSDDGLVYVTRNGGKSWTNVTPKGMPDFGRVSQIDASAFDAGTAYISVRRPLFDDFAPYIFKTTDYGRSWTKIVNGIRSDAYVHAVRQDPHRRGLLYAATQHGVYISYDDGASWQSLTLNMPDIPLVDLVVEDNELVVASHGRGFWVLDNVAPLRQVTPQTLASGAQLFEPPVGVRSGPEVAISWWLGEAPKKAKLEIVDSTGAVLRTFMPDTSKPDSAKSDSARRAPQRRGRNAAAYLPVGPGLNHINWDLRTEGFATFPGMILWGARARGPAVPPGRYTVRLVADGRTLTAPVVVKRNPWFTDVSNADLRAQYAFSKKVRDKTNEANEAVIAIRHVKKQLEDRGKKTSDATLESSMSGLERKASAIEEKIYQVRNRSGQDPLNFPIKVNNRLATLLSMAERGDGRPTSNMPEIYGILAKELDGYTAELTQLWKTDLVSVNRELSGAGLLPVDPNCAKAEGCQVVE
ncbi:MAG TPA: glycosyl hydrolase [Gemmatimonadaceae bacterium]|nr:glycosyl hydrolase [Gemmatimonadaceae bacterium]